MIIKTKFSSFLFMHTTFLLYCIYPLLGKYATKYEILSFPFAVLYCIIFGILFIYALLWQQVLKTVPLSTAIANKSVTIIWGMFFGLIFFNEHISLKMYIGAILILSGIFILTMEKEESKTS